MNISDVIYNMLKLTLNQWVEGSSPSGVTIKVFLKSYPLIYERDSFLFFYTCTTFARQRYQFHFS